MTLVAAQMGFLFATCEREVRQGKDCKTIRHEKNRLAELRDAGKEPEIPDHEGGEYLVEAMLTLPPTRPMAMGGHRPADWPEILAFMQATQRDFDPWEVETLHAMCIAFADGLALTNPLAWSPVERARRSEAGK